METKAIEDLLQAHHQFVQKVQDHLAAAAKGKALSPEALVKEKEELVGRFKARLEEETQAKEQTLKRHDEAIRRHKDVIARMEREIREERKAIERAARPAPAKGKGS